MSPAKFPQETIEAVYQYTVAELEARGSPSWLAFAPLAVDVNADPRALGGVVCGGRAPTTPSRILGLPAARMGVVHDV